MLRGEFDKARGDLTKAYAQDPGNATIANNLKLLDGSERIIKRDPSAF
jgi:Flp pilus assembly protein TadD